MALASSSTSLLACLILFISYAAATIPNNIPHHCSSSTPTIPAKTFLLNGVGFTFSNNINSNRNTKAAYRGAVFITSNATLAHLTAELEFLPGSPLAGAILIWDGKLDFLAGLGTYAVAGGRGLFEEATGSVTETRLTQALSGQSWRLHVDFCVPKKPASVVQQI
ncbi:hypothetical protein SELMODRAFT_403851 [Selaginella moellendorffii]|uniref:Dirigent protein n=1 Tax=Selaginella moellendorffii TaxID=88036 RepID=D8QSR2_SELML|nr:hypothetical protein SELMODRAFT_403851 [Selaginella moellendorffii]